MNTQKALTRQIMLNGGTIVVVALMLLAQRAWAGPAALSATPGVMSYQGYLTDKNGTPINGKRDMTFGLYAQSSGGTALWNEAHTGAKNAVPVTNGLFNVLLGSLKPIPSTVWDSPDLYLEVLVGRERMTPREQVGRVPYAMAASHALTADSATQLDAPDGKPAAAVYVDNSGRVGIGTMEPQWPLHIQSAGRTTRVKVENTGTGQASLELSAGDHSWSPYVSASADKFMIWKEGDNRGRKLEIDADGNLSVGGLRIDGQKPIFFQRVHFEKHAYVNYRPGWSAAKWSCGIVGFRVKGDIDEGGTQDPLLMAIPYVTGNNKWCFSFKLAADEGDWSWWEAVLMCVHNDMASWKPDYHW